MSVLLRAQPRCPTVNHISLFVNVCWLILVFFYIVITNHPSDVPAGPLVLQSVRTHNSGTGSIRKEIVNHEIPIPGSNTVIVTGNARPGEMGKPLELGNLTVEKKKIVDDLMIKYGFNEYVSEMISVQRSLPDFRDEWCKKPGRFNATMQTSIIMTFYNEAWKTFIRAIHSILDRSPDHLIKEIILVDDFSDLEHLKTQLEVYLKPYSKIKIIRAPKRLGLIRARLLGVEYATAPILTFLDSHIETTKGWLEPLIDRVQKNETSVVIPIIDFIDANTFAYPSISATTSDLGGFNWGLFFIWKEVTARERALVNHPAEPMPSPTMVGGLFAIRKTFFEKLGKYDPEFNIWGGENLELSFKLRAFRDPILNPFQGSLEYISCSHVGHIYRARMTYRNTLQDKFLPRNLMRLALVWLEEYAIYYLQRQGVNNRVDYGDISERLELKRKLNCKSFDWYMNTIYPDMFNPKKLAVSGGEIKHANGWCMDADLEEVRGEVKLWLCHGLGKNQHWWYTINGEIRREYHCLDFFGTKVTTFGCHGAGGNQNWTYNKNLGSLKHETTNLCLAESFIDRSKLVMENCTGEKNQRWTLQNYDPNNPNLNKKY